MFSEIFLFPSEWRDTRDEDVCYFLIKYESKTLSHGLSLLSQTHTVPRTKRFEFVAYKGYELIDQVFDVKDHISVYVSLHGFSMGVHIAGVIGRFLQEHRHQMVKYLFGKHQVYTRFPPLLFIECNTKHYTIRLGPGRNKSIHRR